MIYFTFADAFDSLLAYTGGAASDQNRRDLYQAIDEAMREMINAHTWSYLYKHGRIFTNAPYSTGTIEADIAGPVPFLVTLTGGTWPSWASDGHFFVGQRLYRVNEVIDSTHLTMLPPLVSNENIPPGTPYQLYQNTYELPADFLAQDQSLYERVFGALVYVHPREWVFSHRYYYQTGTPQEYTIKGDEKYPNRMVVCFAPLPVESASIDFLYKRRPRPIIWKSISAGKLALTFGSVEVIGTGTAFDQTMVGSVLRVSGNQALPTWMPGGNPATFEGLIAGVSGSANLTLSTKTPSTVTYPSASFVISDPIDIETQTMQNAFMRCCEKAVSQHRIMKDKPSAKNQYLDELRRAKEADSRNFSGRAEGEINFHRQRIKDMPLGADMPLGING